MPTMFHIICELTIQEYEKISIYTVGNKNYVYFLGSFTEAVNLSDIYNKNIVITNEKYLYNAKYDLKAEKVDLTYKDGVWTLNGAAKHEFYEIN